VPAGSETGPDVSVSAIVVNYNTAGVLADCVTTLREAGVDEILVVDNGSTDDSHARLRSADPDAVWLPSGGNVGYGRAANLGAQRANGQALLICNPDIVARPGLVKTLLATVDAEPGTGIVGPRLLNTDSSVYPSARAFPSLVDAMGHGLLGMVWRGNPFSRRYKLLDWDHDDRRRVDWVSGACFLITRQAWEDIGGFDSRYFMYMEDVDLCWRAGQAGWAVVYEPAAEVTHVQGVSTGYMPYRMIVTHHRSLWRFATRTTSGWRTLFLPVVGVGLVGRAGIACLDHWKGTRRGRKIDAVD
jgi:N-acetylglucosaminyl-diphospho-decaprenol L-rhamnosyltransferase